MSIRRAVTPGRSAATSRRNNYSQYICIAKLLQRHHYIMERLSPDTLFKPSQAFIKPTLANPWHGQVFICPIASDGVDIRPAQKLLEHRNYAD